MFRTFPIRRRHRASACALFSGLALALLLPACADLAERRRDERRIYADFDEQESRLTATSSAEALLQIARNRDARTGVEVLTTWTRHSDPTVRASAYRSLGLVGGEAVIGPLKGGLEEKDPVARAAATFGLSQVWSWPLGKLHSRRLQEEIALVLDPAEVPPDQIEAIARARSELALAEEPDWSEALMSGKGTEDLFWSMGLLCRNRERSGEVPPTLPKLSSEMLVAGGAGATYALGYCSLAPGQEADEVLSAELLRQGRASDEDRGTYALRALGRFNRPGLREELRGLVLSDGSPRRRVAALRALAEVEESEAPDSSGRELPWEQLLAELLQDKESWLSDEAASLLARVGTVAAWVALHELRGPLNAPQLVALGTLAGSPEARGEPAAPLAPEVVRTAMDSDDEMLRASGLRLALLDAALLGEAERLGELLAWADARDSVGLDLRVVATLALAESREDLVEGPLLQRLGDGDPLVAAAAARGLAEREGEHITQRLALAWEGQGLGETASGEWRLRPQSSPQFREALASALLGRPGLEVEQVFQMRDDPSAAVRMVVYRHAIEKEERTDLGPVPEVLPLPDLADHLYGAGGIKGATLRTTSGEIELALFPRVAPAAVSNFAALADAGYYDGLLVHRVIPDFVVQAGDPSGTGWGGPGWTIRDEFSELPFVRGSLGMARSGRDSSGSQWFITHSRQPHLDRHYTLFGQVIRGWDVLDATRLGDRITSITVHQRGADAPEKSP
ncbi:MAG: peptidylprolyl isomerase [Myxococcota bacterium]|nr:peptidylprolyl isomerase [Myxococcota bacterium]